MRVCVGLALLFAGPIAPSSLLAQTRSITITQALDMYERGNRSVLSGFSRIDAYGFLLELKSAGPKWVKAKGKDEKPRRLLVMATFALEGANASFDAVPLIEWACDQLRPPNGPKVPLPAERQWHQAALALLEAKGNYSQIQDHLWHLNTRFPDEPLALLARGWMKQAEWEAIPHELGALGERAMESTEMFPTDVRSEMVRPDARPASPYPPGPRPTSGISQPTAFYRFPRSGMSVPIVPEAPPIERSGSVWTKPDVKKDVGRRVIKAYERALTSRSVAAEAELRIGYLYFVSGKTDNALEHLYEVPGLTIDNDLLYLDDLFIGWAAERGGDLPRAEAGYRHALKRVPSGRTAATWLATLLQAQGKLGEAQEIIDASLSSTSKVPDPWPLFSQGDFKHWPVLIENLRGAIWSATPPRSR